ncbi:hypothetical protein GQS78_11775 [Thermococcus bergensis]|jgi:hypothetical protein|nr:hypothetical protein [Thermococcus bergensis]MCA6214902.1 hypothetical protein [Thermococcus bergensis]
MIEIREVDGTNIDAMISVCTPPTISEAYKKGVEIKKAWLLEQVANYF